MVGTGVFVSIGIAAGVAGSAVLPAIGLAAFVAHCNGMSSAQLAAAHPVSGGTYEYGYRYLTPWLGFTAGWMFLCAKSASAATAALGFSGYLLYGLGESVPLDLRIPAVLLIAVLTVLVYTGMKRSNVANTVIASVTLLSLLGFVLTALTARFDPANLSVSLEDLTSAEFLQACALLFVAYTGYGRIATMGEEIKDPRRNIPRAIVLVMVVTATLYISVAVAALGAVGGEAFGDMTRSVAAPLEVMLHSLERSSMARLVAVGALVSLAGVLLNLLLGLSRVLLAMGRRRDMAHGFASVVEGSPRAAVIGVGCLIAFIASWGSIRLSWSFSAFTVLIYYALTNLSALRLDPEDRLYPRFFSYVGLAACLFLAFQVPVPIWGAGLGVLAVGWIGHGISVRIRGEG